ncbi:MAG: hypothetical protein HC805_07465, partial [Alkalinema sp. RL_2_19]|nr:hypothetical protein [Alkalinema sp. RL_2_19]
FATRCNPEMVDLEPLQDPEEIADLKQLIQNHADYTHSLKAQQVLANWDEALAQFVRVIPRDYKRVLEALQQALADGLSGDDALTAAFEKNTQDVARIGGG